MGAKLRAGVVLALCIFGLVSTLREFYFNQIPPQETTAERYESGGAPELERVEAVIKPEDDPIAVQTKNTASPTSSPVQLLLSLDDFNLCKVEPEPELGAAPVDVKGAVMQVEYQCTGEPYHQFANHLESLIFKEAEEKSTLWGRQKSILPNNNHNTNQERSILILGNSHTRQLVSTLLCQYRHQIIQQPKMLYGMPKMKSYGVWEFRLQNNITIYSATNCPFIYNNEWPKTLESFILHRPLQSIDAIVMGRFNAFSESTGTRFYENMMEYQKQFPELKIDFEHSKIPTLRSVSEVYAGPIVYVGMFASYGTQPYREAQTTVEELRLTTTRRSNLGAIDGRHYIEKLKTAAIQQSTDKDDGLPTTYECSTDGRVEVSTCVIDTESFRFQNGHRCMGSRGGHPDLIAWDVVDFLHRVFEDKK